MGQEKKLIEYHATFVTNNRMLLIESEPPPINCCLFWLKQRHTYDPTLLLHFKWFQLYIVKFEAIIANRRNSLLRASTWFSCFLFLPHSFFLIHISNVNSIERIRFVSCFCNEHARIVSTISCWCWEKFEWQKQWNREQPSTNNSLRSEKAVKRNIPQSAITKFFFFLGTKSSESNEWISKQKMKEIKTTASEAAESKWVSYRWSKMEFQKK